MKKPLIALMLGLAFVAPAMAATSTSTTTTKVTTTTTRTTVKADVITAATANGNLKTYLSALKAAGLTGVLRGKGPFTIFAPTDAAFARLPKGQVDQLLKAKNHKKLVALLTYHVVPGKLKQSDLSTRFLAGQMGTLVKYDNSMKTIEGENLKITGTKTHVKLVNNANVSTADIVATNGVIHVIDRVLMPPSGKSN